LPKVGFSVVGSWGCSNITVVATEVGRASGLLQHARAAPSRQHAHVKNCQNIHWILSVSLFCCDQSHG